MLTARAVDVRIIADDLTGALDSAVAFATTHASMDVKWRPDAKLHARLAVDVVSREGDEANAIERHRAHSEWLAGGVVRFKKIDSLLRGHVAAETLACIANTNFSRIVIAPAFPFQGRVTRGGRQVLLSTETIVGHELQAELARDIQVAIGRRDSALPKERCVIYDAETDNDLDHIVRSEWLNNPSTLWVGTGGLANALSRHLQLGATHHADHKIVGPLFGLIGTHHDVTLLQLKAIRDNDPQALITMGSDFSSSKSHLLHRMSQGQSSFVSVAVVGDRLAITRQIRDAFSYLLDGMPLPGCFLVTGGETLRAVCDGMDADRLAVEAAIEPGLPLSRIIGGTFSGVAILSKSGAFGDPQLFARLLQG